MIKSCKFCKKEFNAKNPKALYCDPKCKKSYENSLRGKKKVANGVRTQPGDIDIPDGNAVHTLLGQLTKVTTTADQCLRVHVDIPIERVKFDTIQYLNQTVVIGFVDGGAGEEEKKDGKEDRESILD